MEELVPSGQTVNQLYYIEINEIGCCEEETTVIVKKLVDFVPAQHANPKLIVCEAICSQ
jgi:hypothetical protein